VEAHTVVRRRIHFPDSRLADGGEVVGLTHRPSFILRKIPGFLVLISVRGSVDSRAIVRL
jgi:hypothetical protein